MLTSGLAYKKMSPLQHSEFRPLSWCHTAWINVDIKSVSSRKLFFIIEWLLSRKSKHFIWFLTYVFSLNFKTLLLYWKKACQPHTATYCVKQSVVIHSWLPGFLESTVLLCFYLGSCESWLEFCSLIGISISLSFGFHPQTSSQMDKMNQEPEAGFRFLCA